MTVSVGTTRIALTVVALFVFSIPSENGVSITGVGSLSRLLGFLAIGATLVSLYGHGRVRFRPPSLFLVLAAAFVAWSAATTLWSIVPATSVSRSIQYVQLFVFAWMIHQIARSERDRDVLMQSFVLGAYVMISVALLAYLGSDRVGYRDVGFPANSFAIVASLAIPMAWGLVLRRPFRVLHLFNVGYPLFALLAVVLAASRGGLITGVVALTIIPLTLPHLGTWLRLTLLATVAAIGVFGLSWLPQVAPDLERNLERLGRLDEDLIEGTMTGRTTIWAAGTEVFLTSPIVGVGTGGFNSAVQPILGSARSAHNAFLSVAVASGSIGLILFSAMFVVVLIGVFKRPERRGEYLVLLFALLVSTMPANSENNKYLWYVLAVLSSARPVTLEHTHSAGVVRLVGRPAHRLTGDGPQVHPPLR